MPRDRTPLRWMAKGVAVALMTASSSRADGIRYPERWFYLSSTLGDEEGLEKTLQAMAAARESGCTHVLIVAGRTCRLHLPDNEEYAGRVARARARAEDLGLKVVYAALPTGYAGQYTYFDGNLLAGIPVRDMPFVVTQGQIVPDPSAALPLANPGFEEFEGDRVLGWDNQTLPGKNAFVDSTEKHSGKTSLKVGHFEECRAIDPRKGPSARVRQKIKVKPFQYYRVSYWTKASGGLYPNGLMITSDKPYKQLIWSGIPIRRDAKGEVSQWTRADVLFNTLTSEEITVSLGAGPGPGTAWFDDLAIEPAGLIWIVRREICPLVVTSEDGSTVYEEGRDFEPVFDPILGAKPYGGELTRQHEVPFRVAPNSRLREGQKLRVSFYHTMLISWDQQVLSMQEPRVFEIFEQEVKNAVRHWKPHGIFLNYDEIRIGGWERQPEGENLTPGQILARHVERAVAIVRRVAPGLNLYTWSDMFTPYHNARPFREGTKTNGFYWLCNGNWDGSWEGLPPDVIIMNWYSPDDRTPKFFAERGHAQILCGYYDAATEEDMKKNIHKWVQVTRETPRVLGFMYTTWKRRWGDPLRTYFRLLDSYDEWAPGLTPPGAN